MDQDLPSRDVISCSNLIDMEAGMISMPTIMTKMDSHVMSPQTVRVLIATNPVHRVPIKKTMNMMNTIDNSEEETNTMKKITNKTQLTTRPYREFHQIYKPLTNTHPMKY